MHAKLTERIIKNISLKKTPYEVVDLETNGFLLRVQPSGVLTYYLVYRTQEGIKKRYRLGRHGSITLTQARDLAKHFSAKTLSGQDVQAEKQKAKLETAQAKSRTLEGFTVLKAILFKAVEWDCLKLSPLLKLKPLKTDDCAKTRYLSEDEEQRLLHALESRDRRGIAKRASANAWRRARFYERLPDLEGPFCDYLSPMVWVSMHTGLRRGELFSLSWDQVDLERATLTVMGAYAKNGKTRHVPLNSRALAALQQWYPHTRAQALVFPNRTDQPMDNVRKSWAAVLKEAHIHHFRWHDLRHHFASRLVMAGVDLNTTRELLGHVDLSTTLRYAHLVPGHKAEAVSRLVHFNLSKKTVA